MMKESLFVACPYCEHVKEIPPYIQEMYIKRMGVEMVYCDHCVHPIDVAHVKGEILV